MNINFGTTEMEELLPKGFKHKDYKNFATEENHNRFCQLCSFPLSEISDEEKLFIRRGNAVFNVNMEKWYYSFGNLRDKPAFLIGDKYLSLIMYLLDNMAKYGQDGVLAYAKADDFEFLKYYRFRMNPKRNKSTPKDNKVFYFEIIARGYSPESKLYQEYTTLQRAILIERNTGINEHQDSHHKNERHNFADLSNEYNADHYNIHNKCRAQNHDIFYKKNFLVDVQERLNFTDIQLYNYINNHNLIKDLFSYCNSIYVDLDLTEDISYMSVKELNKHIILY